MGGAMIIIEGRYFVRPPETDGKGCPWCGAYGNGGHGGNCPNQGTTFDEEGNVIE